MKKNFLIIALILLSVMVVARVGDISGIQQTVNAASLVSEESNAVLESVQKTPSAAIFATDRVYYLYNVGADKYFCAANTNGTQASVGNAPLYVKFTQYGTNNGIYLLQNAFTNTWMDVFFNNETSILVNRNQQANYGWTITKVGDYYRLQAAGSDINPSVNIDNHINTYVGLDVTENVENTALSPFLDESEGHYIDWLLIEADIDDFSSAVIRSDVPVTFTNDAKHPWSAEGIYAAIRGNGQNNYYAASWLTMSYSSTKRTELSFEWASYNTGYHDGLQLYIDGVYQTNKYNNTNYTLVRYFLEPGDHIIAFRDSANYTNNTKNWSYIRNIKVKEISPLETAVLTENSQPITFVNNDMYPWTIEDGFIQNGNYGYNNTTSRISTTFTVEKTSKFSFLYRSMGADGSSGNNSYHRTMFKINGIQYDYFYDRRAFDYRWIIGLEPGTYTMEFVDSVWNTSTAYVSQLKDVELSNDWIEVDLATAGTLGYEVLYSGKADVLNDVEFLKVSGPMNAADWTDIWNMHNLLALDLSDALITEIPNNAFDGKGRINSVIMPEGIKRIGEYAFRGTNIRRVNIPSTVTNIAQYAFYGTPLLQLTFAENSRIETIAQFAFAGCSMLQSVDLNENATLKSIDNAVFYNCSSLKEFIMPNSVTNVGYSAFDHCQSMKKIVFSDALTIIKDHVCEYCTSLEDLHLPKTLKRIDVGGFYRTDKLRKVDLPSTVNEIKSYAFGNCAVDSIKLPISMQYLYRYAFIDCKNLKYVEMPSYLESGTVDYYSRYYYASESSINWSYYSDERRFYGYYNNFSGCTAIEKVVMRSATPPVISSDPFTSARAKSGITLAVPSFSVVNYKLDTYWYQFGTIVEGDDVDYWKLTSPLMLTNNRRMQGKPDVDLYYGGQLTVGGNAPFPMGQFNMFVNESNPGRLLNTCDNMTADAATTKFAVDANKWYFFTPLYDVAIADIDVSNSASYVFRYYDAQNRAANGASGSWKNVDTDKLNAGQGYIFHCNTACTITFPADANGQKKLFGTADVIRTLTVNEAENTANRSWNYIGNPYPCYYDIYYMDFTAPITVWTGSTYQAYSIADDEFVLRPMQSFFVQKPDAVDQIIFHKEGRQLTTSIAHGAAARAAQQSSRYFFNLRITSLNESGEENLQSDQTRVVINDNASMGYEIERDVAKFMSFETGVPQLFTLDQEDNSYAINERPLGSGQVALAYYADQEGYYTINTLRSDGEVSLYDAELNKTIDLTQEGYTFHTKATSDANISRFVLSFKVGRTTGIEEFSSFKSQTSNLYDLQGRKTTATKKGIYVKDGRKVVNK